jgi:hypothetical protein
MAKIKGSITTVTAAICPICGKFNGLSGFYCFSTPKCNGILVLPKIKENKNAL